MKTSQKQYDNKKKEYVPNGPMVECWTPECQALMRLFNSKLNDRKLKEEKYPRQPIIAT